MKIYVNTIPKTCAECPCCDTGKKPQYLERGDGMYCNPLNQGFQWKVERQKLKDCPLQSLVKHDARKNKRIAVLEKALELACAMTKEIIDVDAGKHYKDVVAYYKAKAKKEL